MAQQARQNAWVTIQYVNARNGNRPPCIKSQDGFYFTISDAGYQFAQQFAGQQVQIEFFVNARGYNVATGINGAQIPQDPRNQGAGTQQQQQQPHGAPPPNNNRGGPAAPPPNNTLTPRDKLPNYVGLAKSCIEAGLGLGDYASWVRAVGYALNGNIAAIEAGAPAHFNPQQPPQPPAPPANHPDHYDGGRPAGPDLDDEIPF